MAAKSERVELRLDEDFLGSIDAWRREETDLPTRSEAIRRLVHLGLSSSSKQSFTVMRTQIMLASRLPNSDEFISDAALFAWSHSIYPAFNIDSDALAEPFAECFTVTRSMIENLGEYIDKAWLKRKWFTYYELERQFGGPTWHRGMLIASCRYMFLRDMFSGFWEHFLSGIDHPTEAKGITSPFDRNDFFLG